MAYEISKMTNFLGHAYEDLVLEYVLFNIACLILFFCLPVLVIRVLQKRNKKAYLFSGTTDKKCHYAFLLIFLIVSIRAVFADSVSMVAGGRAVAVIIMILVFATVIQLLRWKPSGIPLAYVSVLSFTIFKNWIWISICLMDDVSQFTLIQKYFMYSFHDYMMFSGMLLSLAAVIVSAFIAGYYYDRRFLFRNVKSARCHICGNYIIRGDNYCIKCGTAARMNPVINVFPLRKDSREHCHRCGKPLQMGKCVSCEGIHEIGEINKKNWIQEKFQNIAICIIFLACVCLPLVLNPHLQLGSAKVNNDYVQAWEEYSADPSVADDAVWSQRFHDSLDALYQLDAKWLYVNVKAIKFYEIIYYMSYAEASYDQMCILNEERIFVNGRKTDSSQIQDLNRQFNDTITRQGKAAADNNLGFKAKKIDNFEHLIIDGIRFWTAELPGRFWISVVLMAIALSVYLAVMNFFDSMQKRHRKEVNYENKYTGKVPCCAGFPVTPETGAARQITYSF